MHKYEVGKLYVEGKTQWPEAVDVDVRSGQLVLRLFWGDLRAPVVQAVKRQPVDLGVAVVDGLAFLLYRIEDACDWSDQPVSFARIAVGDRALSPEPEPGQLLLAQIHPIDADTGLLRALRVVTVSRDFALAWRAALAADLADAPWVDYDRRLTAVYARHPEAADLVRLAQVTETGGRVPPGA